VLAGANATMQDLVENASSENVVILHNVYASISGKMSTSPFQFKIKHTEFKFIMYADKYADTLVADNGFALVWPKPEDHLFQFQDDVYNKYFAPDRTIHGRVQVDNIQMPPVTAKCNTHPGDLVFRNERDVWTCLGEEKDTQCDIAMTWALRVSVIQNQQSEAVIVPEDVVPELFDGVKLQEYNTNFMRYSLVLKKQRYAVLQVGEGVVKAVLHGPSDVPTMDS
jgi:hypothetical protein